MEKNHHRSPSWQYQTVSFLCHKRTKMQQFGEKCVWLFYGAKRYHCTSVISRIELHKMYYKLIKQFGILFTRSCRSKNRCKLMLRSEVDKSSYFIFVYYLVQILSVSRRSPVTKTNFFIFSCKYLCISQIGYCNWHSLSHQNSSILVESFNTVPVSKSISRDIWWLKNFNVIFTSFLQCFQYRCANFPGRFFKKRFEVFA